MPARDVLVAGQNLIPADFIIALGDAVDAAAEGTQATPQLMIDGAKCPAACRATGDMTDLGSASKAENPAGHLTKWCTAALAKPGSGGQRPATGYTGRKTGGLASRRVQCLHEFLSSLIAILFGLGQKPHAYGVQ